MDHAIDLDRINGSRRHASDDEWTPDEVFGGEPDRISLYQDIAERRAQLECAETLRRARAL